MCNTLGGRYGCQLYLNMLYKENGKKNMYKSTGKDFRWKLLLLSSGWGL